jgi:DNA-binding transcriptional LysR family regulator
MLDLHRLEILHRFAACGSIVATAVDLGYSSSAVSQQLATLEKEAGVALIERTAHSASLTNAGRELVTYASVILDAVEDAQSRMRAHAGTVLGRIDVSCIPSLAARLAPHLAQLQQRHPDLTIVAHETSGAHAAAAVLDRSADLAVIDDWSDQDNAPAQGLTRTELRREEIVLAVPADHPEAGRSGPITGAALRGLVQAQTWLCAPVGDPTRIAADQYLARARIEPARRWEFQGMHVLAALVATGAGIALLPIDVAAGSAGVGAVTLRPRTYRRVLAITRTATQHDPALASCLAAAHTALAG